MKVKTTNKAVNNQYNYLYHIEPGADLLRLVKVVNYDADFYNCGVYGGNWDAGEVGTTLLFNSYRGLPSRCHRPNKKALKVANARAVKFLEKWAKKLSEGRQIVLHKGAQIATYDKLYSKYRNCARSYIFKLVEYLNEYEEKENQNK